MGKKREKTGENSKEKQQIKQKASPKIEVNRPEKWPKKVKNETQNAPKRDQIKRKNGPKTRQNGLYKRNQKSKKGTPVEKG